MTLIGAWSRRLLAFWGVPSSRHIPASQDNLARLAALCQTVTPEESARLAEKQAEHWKSRRIIESQPETVQPLLDVPETDFPIG